MKRDVVLKKLLERLRESLATFFTGDCTKTDYVQGMVGIFDPLCIWIDGKIFEKVRNSDGLSINSLIQVIEKATGVEWWNWRILLDSQGAYYYLIFYDPYRRHKYD